MVELLKKQSGNTGISIAVKGTVIIKAGPAAQTPAPTPPDISVAWS